MCAKLEKQHTDQITYEGLLQGNKAWVAETLEEDRRYSGSDAQTAGFLPTRSPIPCLVTFSYTVTLQMWLRIQT
jgi:carbonic anhydrase